MTSQRPHHTEGPAGSWALDTVVTNDGTSIPVRATARRPRWDDLPVAVREHIERAAGCEVIDTWSAGTGFTPGFASRLDLADGSRVFVKAASSADGRILGWRLDNAYRDEIRKLTLLPGGIGAPALLWSIEDEVEGERWVVLGLEYVNGRPPRRPWLAEELRLVTDMLTRMAPQLATVPVGLDLGTFGDDFGGWPGWLASVATRDGDSPWLDEVTALAAESVDRCSGTGMAHLDLRDDNILIDRESRVSICDWNSSMLAAPWVDLVCLLLSAFGDGLDADAVLTTHPLTCGVEPRSIDALLANLWLYFTTRKDNPVPPFSPHLRDHQQWYADVTEAWLRDRLTSRSTHPDSSDPGRGSFP